MRINLAIGEAWMEAKYAPTGRASCKGCQNKIDKGDLRLTNIEDEDHFRSEMHYHAGCFRLKPYFKETKYTDVFYVNELKQEDQDLVQQQFAKLTKQQKGSIKKTQNKKQTKKKKADSDSDSDFDLKELTKGKEQKSSQKTQKKQESENSEDDGEDPDYFCLYDDKQKDEFRKIEKELTNKSVTQLKQMLKNNDQKQAGNKTELIQRIADSKILGCLGKCPSCFAGRPKLDSKLKKFKCPGYMDDTEFKNCNKIWEPLDLLRTPWKE